MCVLLSNETCLVPGVGGIGTTSGRKIGGGAHVSVRKTGFFCDGNGISVEAFDNGTSRAGGGRGEKFFRELEKRRVGKIDRGHFSIRIELG